MANQPDERSRVQGGLLCLGPAAAASLFLYGIAVGSYWALALPIAALVLFVLGLVFWIGWTIATVQTSAEGEALPPGGGGPGSATTPEPTTATTEERSSR